MHINDIPSTFHLPSLLWDFMSRVSTEATPSGCRLWLGDCEPYGHFKIDGEQFSAHRLAYVLFIGPIHGDLHVLHRCDTPACINPGHLFLGTEADNHADKVAKGRQARGIDNGSAKINEAKVLAIFDAPGRHADIAKQFGIAKSTVSHIKTGRQWSVVTGRVFSPSSRVHAVSRGPIDAANMH